ncbi:C1 family peptidase [Bradyrhizobium yuanmingense]|uniref:C1 family peptidase n=1 Tax=Bradyrhizobium yuanmingense TaxID=108015 RepID=UPI0023B92AC0|nr:C1 family peptidase [Bradyrhizobium yuanmingense]MDF0515760.1 C1 family peptidase [Bradyrhizobium yuanmingense]
MDSQEIRDAVEAAGAGWKLTDYGGSDAFRSMVGLSLGSETARLLEPASRAAHEFKAPHLPDRFDWRHHQGGDWAGPVRAQGSCMSCMSFAVTAAMEAAIRIRSGRSGTELRLSEADLFFGAMGRCDVACVEPPAILNRARDHGVCLSSDFPYEPRQLPHRQVPPKYKLAFWQALRSRPQRRAAIAEDGPIVACMQIFEDFLVYGGGVYRHVAGNELGLHAVCLVGYDDVDKYWIAKNSWSERHGEGGYFRIAYGECGIDDALSSYAITLGDELS